MEQETHQAISEVPEMRYDKLGAALAKAQLEIGAAKKSGTTKITATVTKPYTTLADVWEAIRGPLCKNGLSVLQPIVPSEGGITIRTVLLHESGQWIDSYLTMQADMRDAKAIGSAVSYGRRYALSSLVGAYSEEDDDGTAAAASMKPGQARQPQPNGTAKQPMQKEATVAPAGTPDPMVPLIAAIEALGLSPSQHHLEICAAFSTYIDRPILAINEVDLGEIDGLVRRLNKVREGEAGIPPDWVGLVKTLKPYVKKTEVAE